MGTFNPYDLTETQSDVIEALVGSDTGSVRYDAETYARLAPAVATLETQGAVRTYRCGNGDMLVDLTERYREEYGA